MTTTDSTGSTGPRIPPIAPDQYTDQVREYLGLAEGIVAARATTPFNIVLTLAQHPDLAIAYRNFGAQLLAASSLTARVKEIATLRTGWLLKSDYEFNKHSQIGLAIGMTTEEVDAIGAGADAAVWSDEDRDVIRAVDQLVEHTTIDDTTWAGLASRYDYRQLLELIMTVGSYVMLGMVIGAARVEEEPEFKQNGVRLGQ